MVRFHGAAESFACVTEPKLELNSGGVAGVAEKGCLCNGAAGAAGKGCYVGVPTFLLLQSFCLVLFEHVKHFCLNLPLFIAQSKPHFSVFITMSTLYPLTCISGVGVPQIWCPFHPVPVVYMCHSETAVCVCVFRTVHITLLVTSVMFVRRGM
jgi:hypothetical protein